MILHLFLHSALVLHHRFLLKLQQVIKDFQINLLPKYIKIYYKLLIFFRFCWGVLFVCFDVGFGFCFLGFYFLFLGFGFSK